MFAFGSFVLIYLHAKLFDANDNVTESLVSFMVDDVLWATLDPLGGRVGQCTDCWEGDAVESASVGSGADAGESGYQGLHGRGAEAVGEARR